MVHLTEVEVKTHEEDEDVLFKRLYIYLANQISDPVVMFWLRLLSFFLLHLGVGGESYLHSVNLS